LSLADAPPEVRARRGVIVPGEDSGPLEVETELGAPPVTHKARLVAEAASARGETEVILAVQQATPDREVTNSVGMKLVLIPRGTLVMGSPKAERGRDDDEAEHEVEIARSFYLGAFEVTQEQYEKVTGKNPSRFTRDGGGGPDHPVECVSYADAVAFCRALSELPQEKQARRGYPPPAEAERGEPRPRGAEGEAAHLRGALSTAPAQLARRPPNG